MGTLRAAFLFQPSKRMKLYITDILNLTKDYVLHTPKINRITLLPNLKCPTYL